jgi:DNA-binding transcriptional LysR family regulator
MLDGLTLDQLRTFVAAADTGSFSAAGRRLGRAQSVVSQTMANLEAQIGVRLFDRVGRYPVLTQAGRALLADARTVAGSIDGFKARARVLAGGLEPELSVVIDVLFPIEAITSAVVAFHQAFPATPLRLEVETLGAVIKPVQDGQCAFAICPPLPVLPENFVRERLPAVQMLPVVSPLHPLAALDGPVPKASLSEHVQLVLTDRTDLTRGRDFGVFSSRTWRLADLGAKHAFLRSGLGFGNMPVGMIAADLANGTLVALIIEDEPAGARTLPMHVAYPADRPPGPAGRWFIDRLAGTA